MSADVAGDIVRLSGSEHHPDVPGPELLPTRLMRATALCLPVAAAGISVFSSHHHRVPLGASDDDAALAERLQFTVGEGPCLAARDQRRPVLATAEMIETHWPAFCDELFTHTPYRSILAVPIVDDHLGGEAAMDLYYREADLPVDDKDRSDVAEAVDVVVALLIAGSGTRRSDLAGPVWLHSAAVNDRSLVWTAAGMIDVALNLPSADALAVLRSYAYSHQTTLDEVSRQLVNDELTISALTA